MGWGGCWVVGVTVIDGGILGVLDVLLLPPFALATTPAVAGDEVEVGVRLNIKFVGQNHISPIAIALSISTTSNPFKSSTSTLLRLLW